MIGFVMFDTQIIDEWAQKLSITYSFAPLNQKILSEAEKLTDKKIYAF